MKTERELENTVGDECSGGVGPDGYSLWEYDGERWHLKKICAVGNAVPGDPPTMAGQFKGQMRATPCVVV